MKGYVRSMSKQTAGLGSVQSVQSVQSNKVSKLRLKLKMSTPLQQMFQDVHSTRANVTFSGILDPC